MTEECKTTEASRNGKETENKCETKSSKKCDC